MLRHGEHPDVVQKRREPDAFDVGLRQSDALRERDGVPLDAADVAGVPRLPRLDRPGEGFDRREVAVGDDRDGRALTPEVPDMLDAPCGAHGQERRDRRERKAGGVGRPDEETPRDRQTQRGDAEQ